MGLRMNLSMSFSNSLWNTYDPPYPFNAAILSKMIKSSYVWHHNDLIFLLISIDFFLLKIKKGYHLVFLSLWTFETIMQV